MLVALLIVKNEMRKICSELAPVATMKLIN